MMLTLIIVGLVVSLLNLWCLLVCVGRAAQAEDLARLAVEKAEEMTRMMGEIIKDESKKEDK